ncbi:hypothetical protein [Hymenobacter convexus]|uniref:hypothetical protein n=1 Tax=Hymenobacter sp. CA1UV-4 TaxID=3063782 RepID=UPI0027122A02|nr:hypothetical protein [Hymenobacter sp. CA1UV-4]MDO7851583.1 hypothetical protein [Hymenobacter sp. CA1UV-4]
MPTTFRRRWHLLLLGALLASCTESKEFEIESPDTTEVKENGYTHTEIRFAVNNLNPDDAQHWQQLWQQADLAMRGFLPTGRHTVRFVDGKTDETILRATYDLNPDLLFQHEIRLSDYFYGERYRSPAAPQPKNHSFYGQLMQRSRFSDFCCTLPSDTWPMWPGADSGHT